MERFIVFLRRLIRTQEAASSCLRTVSPFLIRGLILRDPFTAYFTGATAGAEGAAPFRRISAASSLISVRSRCISLHPYQVA